MQIVVAANSEMQNEFKQKEIPDGVEVHYISSLTDLPADADVLFYLLPEEELMKNLNDPAISHLPVFANAVVSTSDKLPTNFIRINAWPGFLQRSIVEIYSSGNNLAAAGKILNMFGWKYQEVPDIAGMIAARIIAMIINEAYFALGDDVSSKEDIDIAMKLGTNYPFGPFEWSEKIGLKNIANLLKQLATTDNKYTPSQALLKEITD